MAGIDNITAEILQEAKGRADRLISEAKALADTAKDEAAKECAAVLSDAEAKACAGARSYAERIESQIGMRRRQSVLSTKQGLIEQAIETARKMLSEQDTKAYFLMIAKLLAKTAGNGDGEILFNEADKKRIPSDFIDRLPILEKKCGGTLRISEETADIEDGFILRYGGVEENCTLKALFAEKHDLLQDLVAQKLW